MDASNDFFISRISLPFVFIFCLKKISAVLHLLRLYFFVNIFYRKSNNVILKQEVKKGVGYNYMNN